MNDQTVGEAGGAERGRALRTAARGAVVAGANRMGLQVLRSLGRRGIPVWLLRYDQLVATTSRYAARKFVWPSGGDDVKCRFLLELADRYCLKGWVLIAASERDAVLFAKNHELLSTRFTMTVSPWEVTKWAADKKFMNELADEIGVAHPWTRYPSSRDEVEALDCVFPVILKPMQKDEWSFFGHVKALKADSREELLAHFEAARSLAGPGNIMVQELIPGGGEAQFSYGALCDHGHPIASVVARRTRQWPVDFGVGSSYVETIEHPVVEEAARRFLERLGYTGMVEVEFKYDRRTGQYKLLDVNPRTWGWFSIGTGAGVDFPYLLWRLVLGEPVQEVRGRPGVRWMRLSTDIPAAVVLLSRGELTLGGYLRSVVRPVEPATFAWDDPLPGLVDVPLWVLHSLRRRIPQRVLGSFASTAWNALVSRTDRY